MGLFGIILGLSPVMEDENKKSRNNRLEQEMKWNNLDDYEKEEVRKGNYDVYNFEDSKGVKLDEDDYYHDDRR